MSKPGLSAKRFLRDLAATPMPLSLEDFTRLRRLFYAIDGNEVGGNLHIVLDDYNWERYHVEWCRDRAAKEGDVAGQRFAEAILTMTDAELRAWIGCGCDDSPLK